MCGIAGFNWKSEDKLQSMLQSMAYRGPDDDGHFISEEISFGHKRLSIIDLSTAGKQPMLDKLNDNLISYNGEIYNFQFLKKILIDKGVIFDTQTDTEVLLKGYDYWGPKIIYKLIGMFSFVIYEIKMNRLFIARDHTGIKPFYYYINSDKFIFSSTIPAILEHDIDVTPNDNLIRDFLLYNNVDYKNQTFFNEIKRFPKGCYGYYNLSDNILEIKKWWKNKFNNTYKGSYSRAAQMVSKLLNQSINQRLISDVPVGTCLSGGIDSSAIASLINEKSISEISTFSATFPGYKLDESYYIDLISKNKGMKNYKVSPSITDLLADIKNIVKIHGEPLSGTSPYVQNKVFELAKSKNVIVLLDGQGADELFAGYHYFFGFYFKGLLKKGNFGVMLNEIYNLFKNGDWKLPLLATFFVFLPEKLKEYYFKQKSFINKKFYDDEKSTGYFNKFYSANNLHESLNFHLNYKLEHLLSWEDKNSMYHSTESRVPFLDKRLMAFVQKLPEHFIINKGLTKKILRDSIKEHLPSQIINRKDKIGFATPEDNWINDTRFKRLFKEKFIDQKPMISEYIDMEKISIYYSEPNKKISNKGLFKLLFLEYWYQEHFPNKL